MGLTGIDTVCVCVCVIILYDTSFLLPALSLELLSLLLMLSPAQVCLTRLIKVQSEKQAERLR